MRQRDDEIQAHHAYAAIGNWTDQRRRNNAYLLASKAKMRSYFNRRRLKYDDDVQDSCNPHPVRLALQPTSA